MSMNLHDFFNLHDNLFENETIILKKNVRSKQHRHDTPRENEQK